MGDSQKFLKNLLQWTTSLGTNGEEEEEETMPKLSEERLEWLRDAIDEKTIDLVDVMRYYLACLVHDENVNANEKVRRYVQRKEDVVVDLFEMLEELVEWCEDLDLANSFMKIGGMKLFEMHLENDNSLQMENLSDYDLKFRSLILHLLGVLMQNMMEHQELILDNKKIQIWENLFKYLSFIPKNCSTNLIQLHNRSIFVLSIILSNNFNDFQKLMESKERSNEIIVHLLFSYFDMLFFDDVEYLMKTKMLLNKIFFLLYNLIRQPPSTRMHKLLMEKKEKFLQIYFHFIEKYKEENHQFLLTIIQHLYSTSSIPCAQMKVLKKRKEKYGNEPSLKEEIDIIENLT
ncbi:hypothetical protein SNEBB_006312 [Seison nebaliae]|nr:hypothetical protein SNEBB_006312 [Seison nebaliae]